MGWNQGYTIMEQTVIAVYDADVLTKDLLYAIMKPYADSDIDSGGCYDLRSKDGLSAEEIVCKIMEPERFAAIPPIPEQMPERVKQTQNGFVISDSEDDVINGYAYDSWQEALQDERNCAMGDLWREITRREWNFW